MQHFFYNLTIHNTLEPLLTNILYLNCFKLYIQIKWMTYQSPDAKEYQRLSWQHTWTGTNWKRKKNVTNFSFCFSSGQSSRNTFQTNKAVIYSWAKARGLQQSPPCLTLIPKSLRLFSIKLSSTFVWAEEELEAWGSNCSVVSQESISSQLASTWSVK